MDKTRVFVYGTLRKGHGLHRLLEEGGACFVGQGKTANKYQMSGSGIPYVHPDIPLSRIVGEVYEVDQALLKRLDQVEGYYPGMDTDRDYGYFRREIDVELDSGGVIQADIYFNRHVAMQIIESGDYEDAYRRRYEAQ